MIKESDPHPWQYNLIRVEDAPYQNVGDLQSSQWRVYIGWQQVLITTELEVDSL